MFLGVWLKNYMFVDAGIARCKNLGKFAANLAAIIPAN